MLFDARHNLHKGFVEGTKTASTNPSFHLQSTAAHNNARLDDLIGRETPVFEKKRLRRVETEEVECVEVVG
jgi:hypothetical protein